MAHPLPSIETPAKSTKEGRTLMWTEKYRARQFTDLVGDERTHRSVLGWLKGWDPIVFPGAARHKPARKPNAEDVEVRQHRKILLLTGPPGLGKTTLAHVCARQAGYEVLEINASDERSRDVVKGRIRDCVGTENVRGIAVKTASGKVRKAGRPVCVVVDEVDGVVSGAGAGGEGGFIKALIDLVMLDQKNAAGRSSAGKKKKGDNFRLLRPLILICNDVYHPALRPLRQSTIAEVVHIRKPALNMVVSRLKTIFDREGVACDGDGVRRLCEATWGVSSRKEGGSGGFGAGEGDIRGILVVGEWVASKLRSSILASQTATARLTRRWVEQHVLGDLSHGGGGSRGMGRGSTKEVVERVFLDGAGFPSSLSGSSTAVSEGGSAVGVAEVRKRRALDRLRDMVDTCGESDRIITGCFSAYPSQPFQDDMLLSKPDAAYEWLHFHDCVSSRVFSGQEWELSGYLSQPVLAFHHLFSSPARKAWTSGGQKQYEEEDEPLPFTGPKADFAAHEAQKHNKAILAALQSSLSVPLLRSFRSAADLATDLLPPLVQMLSPEVKPVVVGGSGEQRGVASVRREAERAMVKRAVGVMSGVGVVFERGRLEGGMDVRGGGWVYRMEPYVTCVALGRNKAADMYSPLDTLAAFETAASGPSATAPARYAVRQVLEQEHQKHLLLQAAEARQARYRAGGPTGDFTAACMDLEGEGEAKAKKPIGGSKRDFFGRVIVNEARVPAEGDEAESAQRKRRKGSEEGDGEENKVWVSFHEGFSNAVRKPVSLEEVVGGL
ncbi:MAG: hypothetical protein M1832_001926 [Thelocarpon impressellum]|nr:MAG: hypothetical protein M1832_001926 [Thelocarpon impressellum]